MLDYLTLTITIKIIKLKFLVKPYIHFRHDVREMYVSNCLRGHDNIWWSLWNWNNMG